MNVEQKQSVSQRLIELAALLDYPTAEVAERSGSALEELENHYIRLFVNNLGGVNAPPFAGCYLDQADRLDFMARFSGLCRERGVGIDASYPPDYIPLMIEALALLLSTEVDNAEVKALKKEFFDIWPQQFAAALFEHDHTGVYAAVAEELCRILDRMQLVDCAV